jgi:hypothetical protein
MLLAVNFCSQALSRTAWRKPSRPHAGTGGSDWTQAAVGARVKVEGFFAISAVLWIVC